MVMASTPTVVVVGDDAAVVNALRRVFRDEPWKDEDLRDSVRRLLRRREVDHGDRVA